MAVVYSDFPHPTHDQHRCKRGSWLTTGSVVSFPVVVVVVRADHGTGVVVLTAGSLAGEDTTETTTTTTHPFPPHRDIEVVE